MTENTIEKTFRFTEWRDSTCDTCCEYTGVVLLADERVCRHCLETHFDEEGNPIDFSKEIERDYAELAEATAKKDSVVEIEAENTDKAREIMHHYFGIKWAFQATQTPYGEKINFAECFGDGGDEQ